MPGAGMETRIEEAPRCQKAVGELRTALDLLHKQIGGAEARFSAVLADAPLEVAAKDKGSMGTRPPMLLADEIYEAAGVIKHAVERVRSLIERCEL